jgi:hypothetical protein
MKKVTLLFLAMLCTYFSFSQDQLRQDLDFLFGNLNPSEVPSGYLAPYGLEMADKEDFNGVITDSNVVNNLDILRMVYADVYTARFNSSAPALPSVETVNSSVAGASENSLVIFYGLYSILREDAVQQNLLQYSNGQLYDVQGRSQSPYILQSAFVAYPKQNSFENGTVTLQFDPLLYYSNTSASVVSLQANFGGGYQTISANGSTSYTFTDSTGIHLITLKADLSNGSTQYTQMAVWVTLSPGNNNPMARYTAPNLNTPEINIPRVQGVHDGARVYIIRNANTPANQILKPLIVAEGLDINSSAPQLQGNYSVTNLIREWNRVNWTTNPNTNFNDFLDDVAQYDLVFIDWNNGTDDITHNAALLEDIIGRINAMKTGASQQNVVMGISMGGLVTRYCLASMVKRGIDPQTRLLITHDSPHQGAYVPLALQHLVLGLQNEHLLGVRLGSIHNGALDQAVTLLQSPAAQQELVMVATDDNGNVAQNNFLATIYRNMITFQPGDPKPQYQFVATAQGSQCGISPIPDGATLVSGSGQGNLSGALAYLTRGIISRMKYEVDIDAKGLIANPNHQILHFQFRRLSRLLFGLVNNNRTLISIDRNEPLFNTLPWESVPGGTVSVGDRLHLSTNSLGGDWSLIGQWFLGLNYNFTLAPRFGFLPVFSALDVTTPVSPSIIHDTYVRGITPAGVSRATNFIAQEQFVGFGGSEFNQPHTTFTARNAEWLYSVMENTAFNDCSATCNSFTITGNDKICWSDVYTLGAVPAGTTVTWSASPDGLVNITPNANGSQVTVERISSNINNVTITATITNGCNQVSTASKYVQLGGFGYPGDISGLQNVSCGEYVTYQVANIPGASYQWVVPGDWTIVQGQGTYMLDAQSGTSGNVQVAVYNGCEYYYSLPLYVNSSCYGYYYYSMSPNPASSTVTVSSKDKNAKGEKVDKTITEINIYDKLGNLKIRRKFNKEKKVDLNISNLSADLYYLEIVDGTYKERQKLSVVR